MRRGWALAGLAGLRCPCCSAAARAQQHRSGFLPARRDREASELGHQPLDRAPGSPPWPSACLVWGLIDLVRRGLPPQEGRRRAAARSCATTCRSRSSTPSCPLLHGRGPVLLHRPRRDGPARHLHASPTSPSTSSASSGAGTSTTSTTTSTRPARTPSSTGKPGVAGDAPHAVPAGQQADRVRPHRPRRHPLVLGAGLPAEDGHDPGQGQQVPGRARPRSAPSRASAPSCAAPTTRRCCSTSRSSTQAEYDAHMAELRAKGQTGQLDNTPQPAAARWTRTSSMLPTATGSN